MDDEYEKIKKIVASIYEFSETADRGNSFYFRVPELSNYPEDKFSSLADDLSAKGYVVFTSGILGEELFVIKAVSKHHGRNIIKGAMLGLTFASLWYTGYAYQAEYTGSTAFLSNVIGAFFLFVVPIGAVFGLRELARFVAYRRNRMKYESPLFIPDPLGIGTMGVINLPSHPFKTRRSLLEVGSFPIIAGFLGSILLIILGNVIIPLSSAITPSVNSPINTVSLPVIYPLLINFFYPVSAVPNIIAYAGWVSLIVNSFNAVPAGFLDGGIISVGLFGKYSRYISYISVIALILLGVVYNPWIILSIFVIILGLRGPEPLNNLYRPLPLSRAVAAVAILILFLGIIPLPFHLSGNQISAEVSNPNFLIVNGTRENATFSLTVKDTGITSIAPAFVISPYIGYTFSTKSSSPISPGNSGHYDVILETWSLNITGYHNYTLRTYYGGSSSDTVLSVLVIQQYSPDSPLSLLNSSGGKNNPIYSSPTTNSVVNITVENSGATNLSISAFIFTNSGNSYRYSIGGPNYTSNGSAVILKPGGTIEPLQTLQIYLTPVNVTGEMIIIAMTPQYYGAVQYLYFPT